MFNFLLASEYTQNIWYSLELFWKGMLAIFVVIAIIFAITFLMTYLAPDAIRERLEKKEAQKNQTDKKDK